MARVLTRFAAITVFLVTACGEDREPTSPIAPIVQRFGTISVFLNLEGDSSFALKPYAVSIDNTTVLEIGRNSNVETNALVGLHFVKLKPPAAELLWCVDSASYTQSVVVTQNQRSSLEFHVRCPRVEGNGKFIITLKDFVIVNCSFLACNHERRNGAERSTVSFQKMTGEIVVETTNIPFWQTTEIAVPAGVYQMKVSPSSNCGVLPETFEDLIFGMEPEQLAKVVAVHDGETSRQEFELVCH